MSGSGVPSPLLNRVVGSSLGKKGEAAFQVYSYRCVRQGTRSKEISIMSGGGTYPNRIVTFTEVNFTPNWQGAQYPDPYSGFVSYAIPKGNTPEENYGTVTITRTDGKVLSFEVSHDDYCAVEIRENIIRFASLERLHTDGPFL